MINNTIKLLNLEQFNIKPKSLITSKVNNVLYCYITLESDNVPCPFCNNNTNYVHDYRVKKIKHSISTNNPCFIIYKARRYRCKNCSNVFYENNPFSNKFDKNSNYTIFAVLDALSSHTITFSDVAGLFNLTKTSVIRIFDSYVEVGRKPLPKVLCFDEVYTSRKSYQKYAFVMVDFLTKEIVNIYSSRHKYRLAQDFTSISKVERDNVEYIVIDMWDTYLDLSKIYFKRAKIAIDSFHVIWHLNKAMTEVRLRVMRKYDKRTKSLLANDIYYYMLKKFHYFFLKNYESIYTGPIAIRKMNTKWLKSEIRAYLLSIDDELKEAYLLKERYREFNLSADYEDSLDDFNILIDDFLNSRSEEFRRFGRLLSRWKDYIRNSFIRIDGRRLSNGPIEGVISRIKTIMKNANGYKNFNRFKNRVMYSLNKNTPIKGVPKK